MAKSASMHVFLLVCSLALRLTCSLRSSSASHHDGPNGLERSDSQLIRDEQYDSFEEGEELDEDFMRRLNRVDMSHSDAFLRFKTKLDYRRANKNYRNAQAAAETAPRKPAYGISTNGVCDDAKIKQMAEDAIWEKMDVDHKIDYWLKKYSGDNLRILGDLTPEYISSQHPSVRAALVKQRDREMVLQRLSYAWACADLLRQAKEAELANEMEDSAVDDMEMYWEYYQRTGR
eukprot:TRINITY_DN10344_c0_g1_i3.p1 TRINITY_DN10344_c0_g1~~TRINITY_DN10344_c0_g1_i3.p1  ORF type:complete len:232 (-),score=54.60 TRINITY_DN10344_c0_g1_i3:129-824(-)